MEAILLSSLPLAPEVTEVVFLSTDPRNSGSPGPYAPFDSLDPELSGHKARELPGNSGRLFSAVVLLST